MIHILTHAFVKATCFVSSGVKIGMTRHQEIRLWSIDNQVMIMVLSFLLLSGVGGSLIYNSKEIIVFQILMLIVVYIRWKYTKVFFNRVSGMGVVLIKISYSTVMIFVLGGSGFGGVDMMTIVVIMGCIAPLFNS